MLLKQLRMNLEMLFLILMEKGILLGEYLMLNKNLLKLKDIIKKKNLLMLLLNIIDLIKLKKYYAQMVQKLILNMMNLAIKY